MSVAVTLLGAASLVTGIAGLSWAVAPPGDEGGPTTTPVAVEARLIAGGAAFVLVALGAWLIGWELLK